MTRSRLPANFTGYSPAEPSATRGAGRSWWDANAREYLADHGEFLAETKFVWCPEGLTEPEAALLGTVTELIGKDVLEVGCGAAQCSRWLTANGVRAVALDISQAMLDEASAMNRSAQIEVPLVLGDARELPFAEASFDHAFTAYGALPFVAELNQVFLEISRVLRPGGRWVFSVTHPVRWAFPDAPGESGLTVSKSYFDRDPYVETSARGEVTYAEYHRTIGDYVRALTRTGFTLLDIVEPEWPEDNDNVWGGWSPLRGRVIPGTAIFVARRSA
ncbi:class I SAM-dependent methyltransferase [Rarobacter faecitabidus]|nr:class I SAM-dependent methyltransferase [Rarobacter faecitabidus]